MQGFTKYVHYIHSEEISMVSGACLNVWSMAKDPPTALLTHRMPVSANIHLNYSTFPLSQQWLDKELEYHSFYSISLATVKCGILFVWVFCLLFVLFLIISFAIEYQCWNASPLSVQFIPVSGQRAILKGQKSPFYSIGYLTQVSNSWFS